MSVSFGLSPEQEQLKAGARGFAQEYLRDLAAAVRAERDPLTRALLARPVFEKAVGHGFLKGLIPAAVGGAAGSGVDAAIFVEEWAAQSPDFTISFAGPLIALMPVYEVGTPNRCSASSHPSSPTPVPRSRRWPSASPTGARTSTPRLPRPGSRPPPDPTARTTSSTGRRPGHSHLSGWDGDGPDLMTIVCRAPGGISLLVAEREHLAGHLEVEEHYDLPGLRGCLTSRVRLRHVRVPAANLLGEEGQGAALTRRAFLPSGASIGIFAVAAMREAFDIAYRFARDETRGGAAPILAHQAVSDVLADAKGRIEAVRLLAWRALDAVMAQHPSAPELGLHAKILGSETAVEVVTKLVQVVGVTAYDQGFPLVEYLQEALAYPVIEGSNIGVRRRQLQEIFLSPGYDPLAASGMS